MGWFDNINGVKFNVMGVDFTLHSSFEDAKAGKNPWLFCNYNEPNIGFPRDCGLMAINTVSGILTHEVAHMLNTMDTLSRYQAMMFRGRLVIYRKRMVSKLHHVSLL